MNVKEANEYIDKFKTKKGGFSRDSFHKMGIEYPPVKGWRQKIIENIITESDINIVMPTIEERIIDLEIRLSQSLDRIEELEKEVFGIINQ